MISAIGLVLSISQVKVEMTLTMGERKQRANESDRQRRDVLIELIVRGNARYGYIYKCHREQPRIVETLPDGMLQKWRKIEKLGRTPHFRKRKHCEPIPDVEAPPVVPSRLST